MKNDILLNHISNSTRAFGRFNNMDCKTVPPLPKRKEKELYNSSCDFVNTFSFCDLGTSNIPTIQEFLHKRTDYNNDRKIILELEGI